MQKKFLYVWAKKIVFAFFDRKKCHFSKKNQKLETFSAVVFFHKVPIIYELYIRTRLVKGFNVMYKNPLFEKKVYWVYNTYFLGLWVKRTPWKRLQRKGHVGRGVA